MNAAYRIAHLVLLVIAVVMLCVIATKDPGEDAQRTLYFMENEQLYSFTPHNGRLEQFDGGMWQLATGH